jgi:hypothetical protein
LGTGHMMNAPSEASRAAIRLLKQASRVHEDRKVLALALDAIASFLDCPDGSVFVYHRASGCFGHVKSLRSKTSWDLAVVREFYFNRRPALPEGIIMAPVRAGGNVVGVMVLSKPGGLPRGAGSTATGILRVLGMELGYRRSLAIIEAECGVARAVLRGVAPLDVAYRVFHQVRRFIGYNHGATLVAKTDENGAMVVARQVAWTKGKSSLVGRALPFQWSELRTGEPCLHGSHDGGGIETAMALIKEETSPPKLSVITCPLGSHGDIIGCAEISSSTPDFFVDDDLRIVSRFRAYLSWCLVQVRKQKGG